MRRQFPLSYELLTRSQRAAVTLFHLLRVRSRLIDDVQICAVRRDEVTSVLPVQSHENGEWLNRVLLQDRFYSAFGLNGPELYGELLSAVQLSAHGLHRLLKQSSSTGTRSNHNRNHQETG